MKKNMKIMDGGQFLPQNPQFLGFYIFWPFYPFIFILLFSFFQFRLRVVGHISMTNFTPIGSFSGELGHLENEKFQKIDILTKNINFELGITAQHLPLKLDDKLKIMDKFRRTDLLSPFLRKLWQFL